MARTLKSLVTAGMIGLAGLGLMPESTEAQVSGNVTLKNNYVVVPGFVADDNFVLQSSVAYSKAGFFGLVWSNYDTKKGKIDEIDYIVGYGRDVGDFNISLTSNNFDLRGAGGTDSNLYELLLKVSLLGNVSPSIALEQNLVAGEGLESGRLRNYFIFGLDSNFNLGPIPISFSGSTQFNNRYVIDKKGFSLGRFRVGVPLKFKGLTVEPAVSSQKAFDKDNFGNKTTLELSVSR